MQHISTSGAPQEIGPYSQAVRADGFIFIAGQIAIDPTTQQMIEGGIAQQTERALTSIAAILTSVGLSTKNVVRCVVYLKNIDDFSAMNDSYGRFFSSPFPVRSTVAVANLPRNGLVEIEATAIDREAS